MSTLLTPSGPLTLLIVHLFGTKLRVRKTGVSELVLTYTQVHFQFTYGENPSVLEVGSPDK